VAGPGDVVAPAAVAHAASLIAERQRKISLGAGVTTALLAASIGAIGIPGIPLALAAFIVTGRALGRRRRAREIARASVTGDYTWELTGRTLTGSLADERRADLELRLSAGDVRTLRALPAARVVVPK
jgi:hypothetical protein